MATASSPRTDPEIAALIRAHAFAMAASGAVAALLSILATLQLLTPGILGDAAWLGVGRLRLAQSIAMMLGCLGNALVLSVYTSFPSAARLVVRLRVGALKFAGLNLVIVAPLVVLAMAGLAPFTGLQTVWMQLSWPQAVSGAGFVVVSTLLITIFRSAVAGYGRLWAGAILVSIGVGVSAVSSLMASGRFYSSAPWFEVLAASRPSWIVDGFGQLAIFWGCLFCCAMIARRPEVSSATSSRLARSGQVILIVGMCCFWAAPFAADVLVADVALTPSESRGRAVYAREACSTCHVVDRAGIGPDLSRESGARPADWHFAHLFAPRTVTPLSVMPSFAHLFNGAADQPTEDARDLVAYLESLGRAKELAAPAADAANVHPAGMNPARARRAGAAPSIAGSGDQIEGLRLFATYCVGCHGPRGEGDGRAASALRPKPANLAAHRYTEAQIANALWNGVAGTAMPAWRDQPLDRLAHLITAVQTLGSVVDMGAADVTQLATGARVYAANCTQCHGERGGGDGFSAASLTVAPANFQRQQPSLDYALRAIAGGVEGTPMAPWTSRISEQELLAVAHYVRSFYTGGAK